MTIEPAIYNEHTALREKEKADTKLKRNISDIHMPYSHVKSRRTTFRPLAWPVCFALKMSMPTERETRIFRVLYLNFRTSRKSYASCACSLFWMLSWSVSLHYICCNLTIYLFVYLFFTPLSKCFCVTVLYCIRKAVCSAVKMIFLIYFCCFSPYSKRIECYQYRASWDIQIVRSHYNSYFFMTYVIDSCVYNTVWANSRDPSHEIFVFIFTVLLSESGVD